MKHKLTVINLALILLLGAYTIWQQIKTPKIAFVKSSVLISQYDGFISATQEFRAKSMVWESNIDTLKSELEQTMRKFEDEKKTLSEKEKQLTMELINTKQQQLRQYQEGVMQKAQTQDKEMTAKVMEEINEYIKEFGVKNNYTIILGATDVGNIVYSDDMVDITQEVLNGLNKYYQLRSEKL